MKEKAGDKEEETQEHQNRAEDKERTTRKD